ncbi:hypothetical protein EC973_007109 [Apophysomyces ossiformis]|uniref:RRM domain-containing protein n=1 Tax=Apophysomyces ossiformis TaxID=679940 RepID=A0A8H7EUG2_9FUNG|nr:hypothetical protein EC973_007109 [Apophysomyces ossiformis]
MNGSPVPSAASTSSNVNGNISQLNQLAQDTNAQYIIHTGDFGFYELSSLDRIIDRTLRHLVQYSNLIPAHMRSRLNSLPIDQVRRTMEESSQSYLSEFPLFLSGEMKLDVPVYAVWGACEDVAVLEKFRSGEYKIPNLFILDEATSYVLDIGGVSLRLFGLGGAVVQHKLFDNGEGSDTIAGGAGTMWTTALQIGELVETAEEAYDPSETRILVTHASPGREGLLAQLALVLRADFTISAGLHFRYGISYNEFSCQPDQDHYRDRLTQSQANFMQLWDAIREQVEGYVDERQAALLRNALSVVNRLPPSLRDPRQPDVAGTFSNIDREEQAFKNMWNFNLPDAAFGYVVLDINNGRISAETKSQGFNFSYRRSNAQVSMASPSMSSAAFSMQGGHTEKPNQYRSNDWQNSPYPSNDTNQFTGSDDKESDGVKDENFSPRNSKRISMARSPYVAYVGGFWGAPVTEDDIKDFFGRDTITSVKFPIDPTSQLPKTTHCYVDFTDANALDNALAKNGQTLKDNRLVINRPNSQSGDNRGRGRTLRARSYRGGRNESSTR